MVLMVIIAYLADKFNNKGRKYFSAFGKEKERKPESSCKKQADLVNW